MMQEMKSIQTGRGRKRFRQLMAAAAAGILCIQMTGCQAAGTESGRQQTERNGQIQISENHVSNVTKGGRDMEAAAPEAVSFKADDFDSWNKLRNENQISEEFREAVKGFAFRSGSQILKQEQGNANYSPLSLYYTLALAGCGAEGETAAQIQDCLGIQDQTELAAQCRKLYQKYYYEEQRMRKEYEEYGMGDYKSTIQMANSLWIAPQLGLKEAYQKTAAQQFFASSYRVDFGAEETGRQMGEWISKQTKGVLSPSIRTDPETLFTLLNTLYFYGGWQVPFQESATQEDIFTLEDGSEVSCPYLNRIETQGSFQKGDGYILSSLDTNNRCRMVFLLPDEDRNVKEFVDTPEALKQVFDVGSNEWISGKVTWKVPKFSFGSSMNKLPDSLKAMGVERMFTGQAEFSRISDQPLQVSEVIQETHIAIDEQGVEGAAYTMMAMAGSAMLRPEQEAQMLLTRPFLFGIQDISTEAWLFLGICRNPAVGD